MIEKKELVNILKKYGFDENIIKQCPIILARGKLKDIKEIIEYIESKLDLNIIEQCPTILAQGKLKNIEEMLELLTQTYNLPHLLNGATFCTKRENVEKILRLADKESILMYLTISSINISFKEFYSKIQFLKDYDIPLHNNNRLNSIFTMANKRMKKNYGVTKRELVEKYYKEEKIKSKGAKK